MRGFFHDDEKSLALTVHPCSKTCSNNYPTCNFEQLSLRGMWLCKQSTHRTLSSSAYWAPAAHVGLLFCSCHGFATWVWLVGTLL